MHQSMRDRLENALAGTPDEAAVQHLAECAECGEEFGSMQQHADLLRLLRAPVDIEPRAGFYARVMERIEAEGASIWDIFFESAFGRRIAMASMALALLLGAYMYSSDRSFDDQPMTAATIDVLPTVDLGVNIPPLQVQSVGLSAASEVPGPDPDSVLVNLVTYQEQ
jgi:hypothetical protein